MTTKHSSTVQLPSSLTPITHHHHHHHDLLSSPTLSKLSPPPIIVSPMEAESIVSSIRQFSISEIGSSSFLKLFGFQIEKLSLQAHASASASSSHCGSGGGGGGEDEYVIDLLLTHDKVKPLVQTLLAIEAWRIFVLESPISTQVGQSTDGFENVKEENEGNDDVINDKNEGTAMDSTHTPTKFLESIAKGGNSLRVAFILHVETTIVSLLTLLFYRKENVMEIENRTLLSIVDYCARQMVRLRLMSLHSHCGLYFCDIKCEYVYCYEIGEQK